MTRINVDKRDPQTYAILGAAMEVHSILGPGFLERVYQEALAEEFMLRGIPFQREAEIPVMYKGKMLDCTYRADFLCYDTIVVELKALDDLIGAHEAQLINSLKATGFLRGLLINFGQPRLQYLRRVLGFEKEQGGPQITQMNADSPDRAGISSAPSADETNETLASTDDADERR